MELSGTQLENISLNIRGIKKQGDFYNHEIHHEIPSNRSKYEIEKGNKEKKKKKLKFWK